VVDALFAVARPCRHESELRTCSDSRQDVVAAMANAATSGSSYRTWRYLPCPGRGARTPS
jgi:hypothetical protein